MSEIHDQIVEQFESYVNESEKFEGKGVKAAAARARKALGELGKLAKQEELKFKKRKTICNDK